MDILAAACELIGAYLIGEKKRIAFIFNIVGCLAWVYVAVTKGIYGLLIVCVSAIIINLKNYIRWRHEAKGVVKHIQCH